MYNKYSKYKIFHYKEKLDSLPKEKSEILPPIHIRIKPTNVCNHNCWYCAYRVEGLQLGQDMVVKDYIPKEKMMEIIDDCVDMGVKAITFSGGGEPFCYPYFTETINKLASTDIQFAALTNGSLLKGKVADIFAERGTWLRISIDGWDDASYAEYREIKSGEYTKVLSNIENFLKINKGCFLGISFIVDQKNYKHIYDFASQMKDIGVNSIKISPCIVDNDGTKNYAYHQPIFDEAKALSMKVKNELEDKDFEVFESYHAQLETFDKSYDWCPYLQINPVIGADLNIYACHDKAYNLDTGVINSIADKSFKEAWNESKEQFFNISPAKCCNHHCVVDEKNKIILDYLNNDPEHKMFV
jgi:MoaA/NifB/PqqE/SkfB family radical SAM enzyme